MIKPSEKRKNLAFVLRFAYWKWIENLSPPQFANYSSSIISSVRSNALPIGQNLRMTNRGTKKRVLFHKLELYETSYLVASSANNLHVNHHQSFGEKHFAHVIKILATKRPKQHYIVTNINFSLI